MEQVSFWKTFHVFQISIGKLLWVLPLFTLQWKLKIYFFAVQDDSYSESYISTIGVDFVSE